jgi:hypothetical protein
VFATLRKIADIRKFPSLWLHWMKDVPMFSGIRNVSFRRNHLIKGLLDEITKDSVVANSLIK